MTNNPETAGVEPVALLPCPFCACPFPSICKPVYGNQRISVKCPSCHSHGGYGNDEAESIAAWNERAHPAPASNTTSVGEGADKLRVVVHTGDGKTIDRKDDWTLFAGDVPIMDEDGFRSLDGPLLVARAILAMTAAIRSGSE